MNHVGICSGLASLEEHSEIPNGCESSEIVKKKYKTTHQRSGGEWRRNHGTEKHGEGERECNPELVEKSSPK